MTDPRAAIRVVLLESDPAAASLARDALEKSGRMQLLATPEDEAGLLNAVERARPEVVVIDLAGVRRDVAAAVREILARSPESCLIVTGANIPASVVMRAVTAGARGFLLKPYQSKELVNTIDEAYGNLLELRRLQRGERTHASAPARGSIIAVYSPKGGVGCTTIATNLAIALARGSRSVAVVDLDLQFGDVGIALNLRSANSIVDLLGHADAIDSALVEEVFVKHESGLRVLLAPENFAFVEAIDADRVVRTLELLRGHFDYVVCDLWSSLEDLTLAALRAADRIMLVTTPELPALKNLRRAITATTPLLQDERTLIVANRVPGKAGISVADIERGLGRPISAMIPSEGVRITEAINQGISLFDSRARVRAARSYRKLADLVVRELQHRPLTQLQPTASAS